ncbi:homeobox-leucine zipper protein HDG2-like [Daucus carota subsp. sativus]|uniref:homeobox-leucine zipper protein HDG2-like n=1 Tax=Daucus carota subsp. sativus TaxID=79200 RepID=UPI0030828A0F
MEMNNNNNVQTGRQGAGPSGVGSSQNQPGIVNQDAAAAAFFGAGFPSYCAAPGGAFVDYNAEYAGGVYAGYGAASAGGSFSNYGASAVSAGGSFSNYGAASAASAGGSFSNYGTAYDASAAGYFGGHDAVDALAAASPGSSSQSYKGSKRHTEQQVAAMNDYFNNNQHPDEEQRKELARRIGLNPGQVNVWFQNKRSQLKKSQRERGKKEAGQIESKKVRAEMEALRLENQKLRAGYPDYEAQRLEIQKLHAENAQIPKLRAENAHLREEAQKRNTSEYAGRGKGPLSQGSNLNPMQVQNIDMSKKRKLPVAGDYPADSINIAAPLRQRVEQLVLSAAEELKVMANVAESWRSPASADNATGRLIFEASGHTATVSIHSKQLLNVLMDVNEWSSTFSAIVARALTLDILSVGEDFNGALQLMTAEYHIPLPLIPKRECYFARYCTKYRAGVWIVVDVSVDDVLPIPGITTCRKRPSGCVIEELPDGTSKVTWIENVCTESNNVSNMCEGILRSGLGFGAKRWMSILHLHCRRSAAAIFPIVPSTDFSNLVTSSNREGRIAILKLSERMVNNCFVGITGPKAGKWTELQGNFGANMKLMSRRVIDEPGLPHGTLLSGSSSFFLPIPPKMVFNFFSSSRQRWEWDMFKMGNEYDLVHHTPLDQEGSSGVTNLEKLLVQESWSDPVASHIVFSLVENQAMNWMINGGDPDYIALVPSGFTIFPVGPVSGTEGSSSGGTLLSLSYQFVISQSQTEDMDARAFHLAQMVRDRCQKIKVALGVVGPNTGTS